MINLEYAKKQFDLYLKNYDAEDEKIHLKKVHTFAVLDAARYICEKEGFKNYKESCDYIAKVSNGGVRDAIACLDKVADYSEDITIDNTLQVLGSYSYEDFLTLTNSVIDSMIDINNEKNVNLFINIF